MPIDRRSLAFDQQCRPSVLCAIPHLKAGFLELLGGMRPAEWPELTGRFSNELVRAGLGRNEILIVLAETAENIVRLGGRGRPCSRTRKWPR